MSDLIVKNLDSIYEIKNLNLIIIFFLVKIVDSNINYYNYYFHILNIHRLTLFTRVNRMDRTASHDWGCGQPRQQIWTVIISLITDQRPRSSHHLKKY